MQFVPRANRAYLLGVIEDPSGLEEFVNFLHVIDTNTYEELEGISFTIGGLVKLAFNRATGDLNVLFHNSVGAVDIDANEFTTITELPSSLQSLGMEIDARRGFIYIPCSTSNPFHLVIMSARNYSILSDIAIPEGSFSSPSFVLDPVTGRFFAPGQAATGLHVFGPSRFSASELSY